MQAIVLAVDDTEWTHPLAPNGPTSMLPVGRSTAAEHAVRSADAGGADRITLVDPDGVVTDAVPDDVDYEHSITLEDALAAGDDEFVLLPASVLLDAPAVASLVQRAPSMAVARSETRPRFGAVDADGSRVQHVRRLGEEHEANDSSDGDRTDGGVLAFTGAVSLPAACRDEDATFDALVAAGVEAGLGTVTAERWHDLERPWELLEANAHALEALDSERDGRIHPDATLSGGVVVEPEAVVESGVVVEGPALISRGATVGPNAYIRGATYLGPDAHVGHAVEVKNSVFLAGATVGHLSYVGDSVLGRDVNFGANTVVANLRHDDQSVRAAASDGRLSTGRRKFGVVVGENAKTGIGTNLNAGVTLGAGAHTTPGETVVRDR
ncbi:glucose-1-phosphate thymidylyltransferase [Halobacterium zhouii]|uniref:glucose-1-phosphate thymidylyltransferase n=1 Tax=Halobacterium zhouii TaxID=2902624 RepID=UPI001E3B1502|nr:glucose-1-phosphate thymidylyltransferase [Halobacterium zhouii]